MIPAIGCDPGKHGCIGCMSDMSDIQFIRFNGRSIYEMRYELNDLTFATPARKVYVERQNLRPEDLHNEKKIHGIAKLLTNTGAISGALNVLGFEVEHAQNWHYEFGLGGIKNYEARKKAAHEYVKALIPNLKITKDAADGILITVFAWRKENGVLTHGKKDDFTSRVGAGVLYTKRGSR